MTTFFRRSMIVTATAGALVGGSALGAAAETAGPRVDTLAKVDVDPDIAASPELVPHKPIEPADWAALDWNPAADPAFLSAQPRVTIPAPQSAPATQWSSLRVLPIASDTVKRPAQKNSPRTRIRGLQTRNQRISSRCD